MRELQTVFKAMTVKLSEIQEGSEVLPAKSLQLPQTVRHQKAKDSLRRLEAQAERLNQLSAELETAILELKAIAGEVNLNLQVLHPNKKPPASKPIKESLPVAVPYVRQKSSDSWVLTSRVVDLFKAEREAALLAQELRRRATKKRVRNN